MYSSIEPIPPLIKQKWKESLGGTVQGAKDKRGLAIIMFNDYDNENARRKGCRKLSGTLKDCDALTKTFRFHKFAILPVPNSTKDDVRALFHELATYTQYPENYQYFAFTYSGGKQHVTG
jgi:hypothetical protein